MFVVQKLLGHRDSRMTQRYAHLSNDYLREAVRKLNGSVTNLLHTPEKEVGVMGQPLDFIGGPNGSRTRVLALRGPRPRPLDDGTIFKSEN